MPASLFHPAYGALALTLLIFSFNPLIGKWVLWAPAALVAVRTILAAATLMAWHKIQQQPLPLASWRDWRRTLLMGALLGFHWICYFIAIQQGSVTITVITSSVAPLLTALLEPLLLRERLRPLAIVAALIGLIGIAQILPPLDLNDLGNRAQLGAALAGLAAGASFSLLAIFNRRGLRKRNAIAQAFQQNLGCALLLLPALFFVWPTNATATDWGWMLLLGVVGTALAQTMLALALRDLPASATLVTLLGAPILTIFLANWLLAEPLTPQVFLSMGLLLLAILLANWRGKATKSLTKINL